MSKVYILNSDIAFSPEKNQLSAPGTDDLVITLNKPVSRCLELLIERRYSLVPQHDFYPYVWGDEGAMVSVAMLYQCIALLRKALKTFKSGGDKMINTITKKGFSLSTEVTVKEVNVADISEIQTEILPKNVPVAENETECEETIPLSTVKRVHIVGGRVNRTLLILIITLLCLLAFQLIQWGVPSSIRSLSKNNQETLLDGCHVFTDHVIKNVSKVKDIIASSRIDCTKMPYVYMTGYQYNQQVSLFSCDQSLRGSTLPTCVSLNILRRDEK